MEALVAPKAMAWQNGTSDACGLEFRLVDHRYNVKIYVIKILFSKKRNSMDSNDVLIATHRLGHTNISDDRYTRRRTLVNQNILSDNSISEFELFVDF